MRLETCKILMLSLGIVAGWAIEAQAQSQVQPNGNGPPRMRQHDATQAQPLQLVPARRQVSGGQVSLQEQGGTTRITANGVPTHGVGRFPNRGNPHRISAQRFRFAVPATPTPGQARSYGLRSYFGVALNGVPFDPGAAEFWRGNPRSGWQYEALGGAVALGLDTNHAHVQPNGSYHYHGLPTGLMTELGWRADQPSPLIGYAADGFPIYAVTAPRGGRVVEMRSSWRLKPGARPAGGPGGAHDGAFVQDYEYRAGAGDLDECNGAFVTTADYPQGTYAYFLTRDFPVIPRCHKGRADRSFAKRR